MRALINFFLCLVLSTSLMAQTYAPVKDLPSFKTNFAKASSAIQSIESDFVQVKNLSLLKDKLTSKGKFFYKKENKVRIEYTSPYKYCMVINDKQMTVKDEQKTSSYNTRSNKMMQSINGIMLDCMRGTVYANKDFVTTVFENTKDYQLILTPNTGMMKKMFSKIEVYLDKKTFQVVRLNMIETGGDNSLMTFTNTTLNKTIADALFAIK